MMNRRSIFKFLAGLAAFASTVKVAKPALAKDVDFTIEKISINPGPMRMLNSTFTCEEIYYYHVSGRELTYEEANALIPKAILK